MVILVLKLVIDSDEQCILLNSFSVWRVAVFHYLDIFLELHHCKSHSFESNHHFGFCFEPTFILILVKQRLT